MRKKLGSNGRKSAFMGSWRWKMGRATLQQLLKVRNAGQHAVKLMQEEVCLCVPVCPWQKAFLFKHDSNLPRWMFMCHINILLLTLSRKHSRFERLYSLRGMAARWTLVLNISHMQTCNSMSCHRLPAARLQRSSPMSNTQRGYLLLE